MDKQRPLSRLAGVMCVLALVAVFGITASGATALAPEPEQARPDVYEIDAMAAFGPLELPSVTFFHDKHTAAMKKEGKDCTACHKKEEGKVAFKFMRTDAEAEAMSADELKELYHSNCFACHTAQRDGGNMAAPGEGECRTCHVAPEEASSARMPAGFDNALHARHFTAKGISVPGSEKNCAACHHKYDEASKKLVYAEGEEATCRSCHKDEPVADEKLDLTVRTFSSAAHEACVSCHLQLEEKKQDTGPTQCKGCHGALEQAKTAEANAKFVAKAGGATPLPPMPNKPEATLLLPTDADGKMLAGMAPVAFDHSKHEAANDTCRVCHTPDGKAGSMTGASAFDAMHATATDASCIGCHQTVRTTDASCAGCHVTDSPSAALPEESCGKCHVSLPEGIGGENFAPNKDEKEVVAKMMLAATSHEPETFNVNDIPETVKIDALSKEYAASEFPHRKIVLKLLDGMKDSTLAAAFHSGATTMCQGCHHNSPKSLTPPRCASCHAAPFAADAPDRPGLKAAYHGQCMGCHTAMGITELKKGSETLPAQSCVVCHDQKNQ